MTYGRYMTNIRKLFADNMREFRRESGLSQAKLAELAGTATHYIAMIEGCKQFPSPEMIERIASALKKDSLDLFGMATVQKRWEAGILADIETLIRTRSLELNCCLKTTKR